MAGGNLLDKTGPELVTVEDGDGCAGGHFTVLWCQYMF